MKELRLYLRRDGLRGNDDCSWVLRGKEGRILASGSGSAGLPAADTCHLVLAGDLVGVVPAHLPELSGRKLAPLLSAAAEAHALGDAEQLHTALLERNALGPDWLAVIDPAWLDTTLTRLAASGLKVDAALPEYLLLPLEAGSWSLLRHEEGTLLRASAGFGLALDQGDPPAGLRLALDRAAEMRLPVPQRLCLYQGNAVHPADGARWSAAVGIDVDLRGQWSWRDAPWPRLANLLSGRFAPRHDRFDARGLARPLWLGALLLVSIQGLAMTADWLRLSQEERSLRAEMVEAAARVLPAGARIVDPAWQVAEWVKSAQAMQGGASAGMIDLMAGVGKARPSGGLAELREVRYEMDRLVIEFSRAEADWLDRYVANLHSQGLQASHDAGPEAGRSRLSIGRMPVADKGAAHGR